MNLPGPDPINEFSSEFFGLYRDLLQQRSGMVFDETKRNVLRNALIERMAALQIADYRAYYDLLKNPPKAVTRPEFNSSNRNTPDSEMLKLVEAVAINETSFFRNKEHYR